MNGAPAASIRRATRLRWPRARGPDQGSTDFPPGPGPYVATWAVAPYTTSGPAPAPDPNDRPLVVKAAYAEVYARVWERQAGFGLTLLELVGCVQRTASR